MSELSINQYRDLWEPSSVDRYVLLTNQRNEMPAIFDKEAMGLVLIDDEPEQVLKEIILKMEGIGVASVNENEFWKKWDSEHG